jgi:hypothetical protein
MTAPRVRCSSTMLDLSESCPNMKKSSGKSLRPVKAVESPFVRWGRKIRWERRVKAVCKPCWELKYCPYGPLVEQFPLRSPRDDKSCRIFGHDCPVFHSAEPLTETRELRNISRSIPRTVQFRVLKRENQICRHCGGSVKDEDVEFDHIIPWSKGGSSDESNIRLLCRPCNRKRRADYEAEFLVTNVQEHLVEPQGLDVVRFLMFSMGFGHDFKRSSGLAPTARDYADQLNRGDLGAPESHAAACYSDVTEFFSGPRPAELSAKVFRALKERWGGLDGEIHPLGEISQIHNCPLSELVDGERALLRRLGFNVKPGASIQRMWGKL